MSHVFKVRYPSNGVKPVFGRSLFPGSVEMIMPGPILLTEAPFTLNLSRKNSGIVNMSCVCVEIWQSKREMFNIDLRFRSNVNQAYDLEHLVLCAGKYTVLRRAIDWIVSITRASSCIYPVFSEVEI